MNKASKAAIVLTATVLGYPVAAWAMNNPPPPPVTTTVTTTLPGTTTTVVQPFPVTVVEHRESTTTVERTLPAQTTTVVTPAPPAQTTTVTRVRTRTIVKSKPCTCPKGMTPVYKNRKWVGCAAKGKG